MPPSFRAALAQLWPFFFRGEAVVENAREIFGRNADAIVRHLHQHAPPVAARDAQRQAPVAGPHVQRLPGIADEVDENQENLVAVDQDGQMRRGGSRPRPGPRCGRSGAAYGNNPRLCFASATR